MYIATMQTKKIEVVIQMQTVWLLLIMSQLLNAYLSLTWNLPEGPIWGPNNKDSVQPPQISFSKTPTVYR